MNNPNIDPVKSYCVVNVEDFHAWKLFVTEQIKNRQRKAMFRKSEFCGETWIYRGQKDALWDITSTLQREMKPIHNEAMSLEHDLRGKELSAIQSFKALAWKYVPNPNMTYLEWLMLMRHYGVPTRLVDFTESPMVALHFAVRTEPCGDFAVWALNRDRFRDAYIQSQVGTKLPGWDELTKKYGEHVMDEVNNLDTADPLVKRAQEYLYNFKLSDATIVMRNLFNRRMADKVLNTSLTEELEIPSRIGAIWFSPECPTSRMMAQKGLFVMPLRFSESFMDSVSRTLAINAIVKNELCLNMEKIDYLRRLTCNTSMIKFVFKKEMANEVSDSLLLANCSHLSLFPDIDGVAAAVTNKVKDSLSGYVRSLHELNLL